MKTEKNQLSNTAKKLYSHDRLEEHIQSINKNPSTLLYPQKEEAERLYKEVRKQFYNFETHKWCGLKKYTQYINEHHIAPGAFIDFIKMVFSAYFRETANHKGRKPAFELLDKLKKSKTFNASKYSLPGIPLKEKTNIHNFLDAMKKVTDEYLDIPHEEMITLIFKEFNTGKTRNTLKRYYFD